MNAIRVAVLSDNRLFCEGLLRIIGAEASFAAVGQDEEAALRPALRAARCVESRRRSGARCRWQPRACTHSD